MSVVPNRLLDFLSWAELHAEVWAADPVAIGLSVPQATALATAVATANSKYQEQLNALELARAATVKQQDATREARTLVADAIRSIRAFAEQQSNPNDVYTAAQIPPPAAPSPAAPPGQPTDFRASLNSDGSIRVTWKAANPSGQSGTVWFVRRRLNNSTTWTQAGVVGERSFTDETIPSSSGGASYIVQGQRGSVIGPASNAFTVQFGVDGGGGFIITSTSEDAKLAA